MQQIFKKKYLAPGQKRWQGKIEIDGRSVQKDSRLHHILINLAAYKMKILIDQSEIKEYSFESI